LNLWYVCVCLCVFFFEKIYCCCEPLYKMGMGMGMEREQEKQERKQETKECSGRELLRDEIHQKLLEKLLGLVLP